MSLSISLTASVVIAMLWLEKMAVVVRKRESYCVITRKLGGATVYLTFSTP